MERYLNCHDSLRLRASFTVALTVLLFSNPSFAQQARLTGSSNPNLDHVAVPPPTEFLNRLLSSDAQTRVEALKLVGVAPLFLEPKTADGEDWTLTFEARLLYGHYSEDRDLAIIVLKMHEYAWASVLLRSSSGWKRIGVFECWCKYKSSPLEGFIELRPVLNGPQTDILVHDSGGGSGLYARTLRVFHIRNGQMETIYERTDKLEDCHPTQNKSYCTLTEAKIEYGHLFERPALTVVELESLEPIPPIHRSGPPFDPAPQLEVYQNIRRTGCEVLLWDDAKRSFVKSLQRTHSYCSETGMKDAQ